VSCGAISVEELAKSEFKVYPNPTQGVLQIELGSKVTGPVQLRVLDMSGRTVLNQPLLMNGGTRNSVDMRGLQSGNYMVQLTTSQWVKTQRVQLAR
nr:T9SS type A sorting domain-containing protein [Flavobacteriales bacterium]